MARLLMVQGALGYRWSQGEQEVGLPLLAGERPEVATAVVQGMASGRVAGVEVPGIGFCRLNPPGLQFGWSTGRPGSAGWLSLRAVAQWSQTVPGSRRYPHLYRFRRLPALRTAMHHSVGRSWQFRLRPRRNYCRSLPLTSHCPSAQITPNVELRDTEMRRRDASPTLARLASLWHFQLRHLYPA